MDRQREDAAAAVLARLIPQARIKRTCLQFLADSIRIADKSRPDRWGVTLAPDYVRLNVGRPAALSIGLGYLHLSLDLGTIPKKLMPVRTGRTFEGRWEADDLYLRGNKNDLNLGVFSSVPGSLTCYADIDLCSPWLPVLRHSHHSFIEKAAQTGINGETKSAHSPNVISYLAKYLNQKVPQPSYNGSLAQGELESDPMPEEALQRDRYFEGSVKQVLVDVYERNPEARSRCLERYGYNCYVCGFSFEQTYGKPGERFIHVHHLEPLSGIRANYELHPIKNLRPVCANCHEIIHRKSPPYSVAEVKKMLRTRSR